MTIIVVVITEVTMNTTANPMNTSQCLSLVLLVLCSLNVSLFSLSTKSKLHYNVDQCITTELPQCYVSSNYVRSYVHAKQKHLGCKKIARPRRSSIVNKSATKSSDIR